MNEPRAEVRGVSVADVPARFPARAAAFAVDFAWILALYSLCIKVFSLSPVPDPLVLLGVALLAAASCLAQQALFSGTLGQRLWKLRLLGPSKRPIRWDDALTPRGFPHYLKARAHQQEKLDVSAATTAAFVTVLTAFGAFWIAREAFWKHPLLAQAGRWELPAFAPPAGSEQDWTVSPYFYSLGAWPRRFDGAPVLYTLPYEKGPPVQFVGHIVARWEMPDVKMTAEGPRTPAELGGAEGIARLRDCLLAPWHFACLRVRETALNRHIQEMRKTHPRSWQLRWFEVSNPSLPESERPQGIYLSGSNDAQVEERYIIVTPQGQHQAFVLDRPAGPKGERARELFEQALRSQRVAPDLTPGKSWVERQLQDTRLDDLKRFGGDPAATVARISEIQAMLLAKASVDPRDYEAFFHLGGTALMILRQSMQAKGGELRTDWSAAAKPTLLAAIRYAQDIAPTDPRTRQLQQLWLDFNKR